MLCLNASPEEPLELVLQGTADPKAGALLVFWVLGLGIWGFRDLTRVHGLGRPRVWSAVIVATCPTGS